MPFEDIIGRESLENQIEDVAESEETKHAKNATISHCCLIPGANTTSS